MQYFSPDNEQGNQTRIAQQKMITGRYGHVSALMADGRVLTAGGLVGNNDELTSAELFDPRSGQVERATDMTERRGGAAAALLTDSVYVCGGYNGSDSLSTCERFQSDRWTTGTSMRQKRSWFTMVPVDGKLFAIGGYNGSLLSWVERFDPKKDQWQFVSPMSRGRDNHGAAVLNGYIYVCGGLFGPRDDCERYDPQRDRWETAAPMNEGRYNFNLVAMNGQLYALKGRRSSVDRYYAKKNEWTLLEGTFYASAVVL